MPALATVLLCGPLLAAEAAGGAGAAQAAESAQARWLDHPENEWVRRSPREGAPAPGFTYEGGGGYDPYERKWIHHGGHDGIPQGFHTFTFDLDTGAWKQRFPPTSPPGACCIDGSLAFDRANRRLVRFPGGSLGHGYQWSRGVYLKGSPVWLYDLAADAWTDMRPPPYKRPEKYSRAVVGGLCSGAVYDEGRELVLSFGGTGAGGAKNALFAYDAYANALQLLDAANPPPERDGMGLACDADRGLLVLFGSQYLTDARTWLCDLRAGRWEARELDPHPPAAKVTKDYSTIPRMAWDSLNGVVLCLAWLGEEAHETWALDPGAMRWTKVSPKAEAAGSKSRSRNLCFDAERNLFILETTSAATGRPEVWTYRYRKAAASASARPRPEPPSDLKATTEAGGRAVLEWKASPSPGVKEHRVYRARSTHPGRPDEAWNAEPVQVAAVQSTRFEDAGLERGAVYRYRVTAVGPDGLESRPSFSARTQPRVLPRPVVSVLAADRVEVRWSRHAAEDVAGYNVYRGLASVRTVKRGEPAAWRDNDPEHPEPVVAEVLDITGIERLNAEPLEGTRLEDRIDLRAKGPEAADHRHAVYAYVVRAVNRLGVESGPSPYGLTIPSEPAGLLCREAGEAAELRWDPNPEAGIAGYRVYVLGRGPFEVARVGEDLVRGTSFRHQAGSGPTRYWVTAVDALGQEGQPSSPAWFGQSYKGFFEGEWHP
ncbi:MAG: fibronectin type III domain-containing protein [Planctomycetes bacterium]|nr:fibronectin type III domain-containing protein [Planctomycetota bacterium]